MALGKVKSVEKSSELTSPIHFLHFPGCRKKACSTFSKWLSNLWYFKPPSFKAIIHNPPDITLVHPNFFSSLENILSISTFLALDSDVVAFFNEKCYLIFLPMIGCPLSSHKHTICLHSTDRSMDYGHTKAKSLILCGANSNPNSK